MLKWLNPEIALGFLVATVLWTVILGWQASYAPTEIQKQYCYESAKKGAHSTEDCKSLWERTTSDPLALYTFGTFIFTGVLGVSTIFLWRVTRVSANAALRQAKAMVAVESPVPVVPSFKLVSYVDETNPAPIDDPVPPGMPPDFCRALVLVQNMGSVRRQSFWDSARRKLREALARLVDDVRRLAVGASSGVVRWSGV